MLSQLPHNNISALSFRGSKLIWSVLLTWLCSQLVFGVLGNSFDFNTQIQLALKRYGGSGQHVVTNWRDMLINLRGENDAEKINGVNDFFNRRIAFLDDIDVWGQKDYWATPLETMGQTKGDCEDFAIAKYFSLLILNVPPDRLRITYVRARIGGPQSTVSQAHMVLGYYPEANSEPLILDNLLHDIRPASRRPDLTPIFSFNSDGLWVGASPAPPGSRASDSSTARLSRWRDLLARMHADGFH